MLIVSDEASDATLLDLEFTKGTHLHWSTWPTSGFKTAILSSIAAYKNLFILVVTIIEASKQSEGHTVNVYGIVLQPTVHSQQIMKMSIDTIDYVNGIGNEITCANGHNTFSVLHS